MNNFDAWLTYDSETENREAAEDAIEEHKNNLLYHNDDYNCCLFENFSEDLYNATIEQARQIEEYLRNKDFEKLGRLVYCISQESRDKHAYIQAEKDWHNGHI
jgi:hypothetical protein